MFIIKPYSSDYQAQVLTLIQTIQRDEFAIAVTLPDQPDLLHISDVYQTKGGNFWVATMDNIVIGTIALLDIGYGHGALRKMFVHKDFRGRPMGCGQKLLDTLLVWAQQQAMTTIYLGTTDIFKAAHRFYEKNGFTELTQLELPLHFPQMQVDTKFYKITLISNPVELP